MADFNDAEKRAPDVNGNFNHPSHKLRLKGDNTGLVCEQCGEEGSAIKKGSGWGNLAQPCTPTNENGASR